MTELVKSLGIEWPVMVAQLVNFAILLFILGKFVYRPVIKLLDERRDGVARAAESEKQIAERLAGIGAERERFLVETRKESERIIDEAKKGGENTRKKLIEEAQAEILLMRAEAERRLAGEKNKLASEVRKEIGTLIVDAIERSFSDVLDARTQGRMVEQALAAIRETQKK